MKKVLILVVSSFLLVSCFNKEPDTPPKQVKEVRKVRDFTRIDVQGNVDLTLRNSPQYQVVVEGLNTYVEKAYTVNKQGTLEIESHNPVKVSVSLPVLRSLVTVSKMPVAARNFRTSQLDLNVDSDAHVSLSGKIGLRNVHIAGSPTVEVKGLSSRDMNVVMKGFPRVSLRGVANLKSMRVSGDGSFNLSKVNSPLLDIKVRDKAKVELVGTVRTLHLDLYNDTEFEGRDLVVQKAMVKTYDKSVAKIYVKRSQNTLASDGSSIYFYNEPYFMANHMAENGAVLHLNEGFDPGN